MNHIEGNPYEELARTHQDPAKTWAELERRGKDD